MTVVNEVIAWLTDPAQWSGPDGIPVRTLQHLWYSLLAASIAAAIALPVGVYIGHTGRGATFAVNLTNLGRAIPTLGIIILVFIVAGFGFIPVLVSLVALGVPPIVTNSYIGVRSVDPDARTIEFDLAYFLSGEEADQAYQEATGDTGHVPNDHFVVNDNPRLRTLTLAPYARLRLLDWNHCCETFFDGDLSLFAQAIQEQGDVTDGGMIYRGQSSWWISIDRGVVTEIEEQYSP